MGYDLDGNELSIEADELLARCFQHELDHLDGVLYLERLDADDRKAAMQHHPRAEADRRRSGRGRGRGPACGPRRLQPPLTAPW